MEKLYSSTLKLGIIAGGQLGKMLIQDASKWDIQTYVLDPEETCPARGIASVYVKGDFLNYDDVYHFGKQVDVLTYELENINVDALHQLKKEGLKILPDPEVLELIQDKGLQKLFYEQYQIPTAAFGLYSNKSEIIEALQQNKLVYPFVQKIRKGGYDGRGIAVIESAQDLSKLFDQASVVEQKIDIIKEIAVIAARNESGEVKCFPAVEMVFDKKANLVEKLICPSQITGAQANEASEIASLLITKLNLSGLLAVEYFVDIHGRILVNEVAPRPHNSGHHTIESVVTSQFEQHLRAILNLPLGSTQLKMPAVMVNLIGEENYSGLVKYEGLSETMALEGVKIHLYGKKQTRPFRKMGHVTIISTTMEQALEKALKVQNTIKVKS